MKRATLIGTVLTVVCLAPCAGWGHSAAQAAGFVVNIETDTVDAAPGDGSCADAGGACSLRAAVQETNALAGADTISLPAGTFTISVAGAAEDQAATGDLDITDDLTISGAGSVSTIIDGGALDRVLHVDPAETGITVDISGVTIRNGSTPDLEDGGGILNLGTLVLSECSVTENAVTGAYWSGGGIFNSGTLTMTDSSVTQNYAEGASGGITSTGTLELTNTVVADNTTPTGGSNGGGGMTNTGTATLTDCTITGNTTGSQGGGGIRNWGAMTLDTCTITGNTAQGTGGGISHNMDTLTIIDTTISGNTSHNRGGGVYNSSAIVNIQNSTISSNTHDGVRNDFVGAVLTLTNCTVSGNTGGLNGGGVINNYGATANLNNVTVVNNVANSGQQTGNGGGVVNLEGTVNLSNTIVAHNSDYAGNPDCRGTLTSAGYNLIRTVSSGCTIAGDTTGNITGQHARLGPLQDNGGPTATHAPGTKSPARDNGSPATPGSGGNACEATDQRGVARPLEGDGDAVAVCDIGAHEATYSVQTFTVNSADDADDGTCDVSHCSFREAINASNATSTGVDTIAFNITGDGPHTIPPAMALPDVTDPVIIDGYTQPGASPNTNGPGLGSNAVLKIELNGSSAPNVTGLRIVMGETTVRGLVINRFLRSGAGYSHAIEITGLGSNVIEGNFLGTDTTGSLDYGNTDDGVFVYYTNDNIIGGTTPAARNVISGNEYCGIQILGSGNRISGNFIGLDAAGTAAIPNRLQGVDIIWGTGNVIGGTATGAGNVISGNGSNGITLQGTSTYDTVVQGNLIGSDVTGTVSVGNGVGVRVQYGPIGSRIGGTTEAERNVISGNLSGGVVLSDATDSVLQGNFIGTAVDGVSPLGNGRVGVSVIGSGHLIGGTEPGAGNVIAFNGAAQFPDWYGPGVKVTSTATGASILSNAIHSNLKLGINLDYDEVTPNDPGDTDTGPNNLQNFPDLTTASSAGGITVITGTLDSLPDVSYTVQFFGNTTCDPSGYGEGERFLGSTTVDIGEAGPATFVGTVDIEVPIGEYVAATATDVLGNTSEFSLCATVLDGDCNGNDVHDSVDIAGGSSQDCNENGIPDDCDIDVSDPDGNGEVSIDCDGNGTPDECEADCNDNGVSDVCDVDPADPDGNDEVSADCNGDGTPDECEADSDDDGVIDGCDICPGFDDNADADGDGVPNGCDPCPNDNPDDTDADGVCDSNDICPGGDDNVDGDDDGVPDDCDPCPLDNPDDTDADGVCDSSDICPGFDDNADADGDTVPDGCDPCPNDNPDDTDGDGVCDSNDICPGFDDNVDTDGDTVPDGCDPCPLDNPDDTDADGVCDSNDICPGFDDHTDADSDTVPDGCDPCPNDNPDDTDADGVCDSVDICPGGDDNVDADGDGVPNDCDPCPNDNPDDTDGDGVCESEDVCPGGDDSVDTDVDGVPDDCDPCPIDNPDDTDGDGVCDSVDICAGGDDNVDTDADSVPDDCDVCAGGDDRIDCQPNGTPDDCDLADGTSNDCNTNGVPDECDISEGSSFDCDADVVPDDCEPDFDDDSHIDDCDNCPYEANIKQLDEDGDGKGDLCDNCRRLPNSTQDDGDRDGVGDACDNCLDTPNQNQEDSDGDGLGDACDPAGDFNGDGIVDLSDIQQFIVCMAGPDQPVPPGCAQGDTNSSGVVDLNDFANAQRSFGAP